METEESRDLEAEAAELEERERTLEARKRDLEAEKKALRAEAASLEGAEVKSKKPDKVSWDQVRRLYLVAFAGMLADKQPEPEPYRDRTLVMLMHLEDQEAWKKIYTTVKTLTNEVFE